MAIHPVLIAGAWRAAQSSRSFGSENPALGEKLPGEYPISDWADCDAALAAATAAAAALRSLRARPDRRLPRRLRRADRGRARPSSWTWPTPRPACRRPRGSRTSSCRAPPEQLRQAAEAAREGSWALPTIDTKLNIRSVLAPHRSGLGLRSEQFPVRLQQRRRRRLRGRHRRGQPRDRQGQHLAPRHDAAARRGGARRGHRRPACRPATVQLIYRTSHAGRRAARRRPAHGRDRLHRQPLRRPRAQGRRRRGRQADLPGAVRASTRSSSCPARSPSAAPKLADEFVGSCLMGTGQFCTNPGLVLLSPERRPSSSSPASRARFEAAPVGAAALVGRRPLAGRERGSALQRPAPSRHGRSSRRAAGYRFANTLLRVVGERFSQIPEKLQTEAFGNASLFVVARRRGPAGRAARPARRQPDRLHLLRHRRLGRRALRAARAALRARVGRLLNDKMPTGVAVSPAMNHGGPYPGDRAIPASPPSASPRRCAASRCCSATTTSAPPRLPAVLRDKPPNGKMWR